MDKLFRNYSLSTKHDLHDLSQFGIVQITLNGKTYIKYRESARLFANLCEKYPQVKFICHYDFYHHASKYYYYKDSVQNLMLQELASLLNLSHSNFVGVVLHSDCVYKRGFIINGVPNSKFLKKYNSFFYDTQAIWHEAISGNFNPSALSYESLAVDLLNCGVKNIDKLYVETCINSYPDEFHVEQFICDVRNAGFRPCFDTEHLFAAGVSNALSTTLLQEPCMIHFNSIPGEVACGSRKDKHSNTTIFECTANSAQSSMDFVTYLNEHSILWVREVSTETIIREQSQLLNYFADVEDRKAV